MIAAYKGRDYSDGGEKAVYRDIRLTVPTFSIAAAIGRDATGRGDLQAKGSEFTLVGCRTVVTGRARRLLDATAQREIVAWVVGKLADGDVPMPASAQRVTYHPRDPRLEFFVAEGSNAGEAVRGADAAWFRADGSVWMAGIITR